MSTYSPQLFCAVETWLNKDIPDGLFCPNDYSVVRFDRLTRGGGVALFLHKSLNYNVVTVPNDFADIELVCVDILCTDQPCRVIAYYRQPGFGVDAVDYVFKSIQCFQKLCATSKHVVILGDFNLPDLDWNFYHGPDNIIYNLFCKFINTYGLSQFVQEPTRNNNILDLVLCSLTNFILEINVSAPIGNSDHNVINFTPNINHIARKSKQTFLNWSKADFNSINGCLLATDWNNLFQTCFSVEDSWSVFISSVSATIEKFVPKVEQNSKSNNHIRHYPFYIRKLLKGKAIAWKRWKLSNRCWRRCGQPHLCYVVLN